MSDVSSFTGVVVARVARPYGSFADRVTGEVKPPGVTRRLWLSEGVEVEPIEVTVREPEWAGVRDLPFGAPVLVTVDLRAVPRGDGAVIVRTLVDVRPAVFSSES